MVKSPHLKQLARFASVGLLNTTIDVGLFTVLRSAGVPLIPANIISTSTALTVSYLLNFRFTFKSNHNRKRLVWFIAVTCTGLWVLHPLVIKAVTALDGVIPALKLVWDVTGSYDLAYAAAPKLAATAVTLVWNYAWYSLKIFGKDADPATLEESEKAA